MKISYLPVLFALLLVFNFFTGCTGGSSSANAHLGNRVKFGKKEKNHEYHRPVQTGDGWETAHIDSTNLDQRRLHDLTDKIHAGIYQNIDSILIVKDGKLVFEEYFSGNSAQSDLNRRHPLHSATKSVASALIGIAIDKGMIESVDEKMTAVFPEHRQLLEAKGIGHLTLAHVLSMTSGFEWNESAVNYMDPRNPFHQLVQHEKGLAGYVLGRPIRYRPGVRFTYDSGQSLLLGAILEKKTSLTAEKFAKIHLFDPLGISDVDWGREKTSSGLSLRSRDMAKFGYLYVNGGKWKMKQVISEKWVTQSTMKHIPVKPVAVTGYGYQWWHLSFMVKGRTIEAPTAIGYGGQFIILFPKLDMVVVFTGRDYFGGRSTIKTIMMVSNHILTSVP